MTNVIESINIKIDRLILQLESIATGQLNSKIEKIVQHLENMDVRLLNLELTLKHIEIDIQNKGKSFKKDKAMIVARTENPIKINVNPPKKGSYDEWILNSYLSQKNSQMKIEKESLEKEVETLKNLKDKELIVNKENKEKPLTIGETSTSNE